VLVGLYNITNSLEEAIEANFFVANSTFVFRYRRNSMYALGQWQIQAVNKLRNTKPTLDEKKADVKKHHCDHISYTIAPDSPFAIEKIGERLKSFQGGEYDDIQAVDDCVARAEHETYLSSRIGCTVTLDMVYIPWLQGNEKVRFKYSESGEIKDWIIKNISSDHPNGTMNVTMEEFYPYYSLSTNEIIGIYEEIPFIESTGSQYIDTEYTPNSNTRVVIDFQYTVDPSSWGAVYSSRTSSPHTNEFALWRNPNGQFRSNFYNDTGIFIDTVPHNRHIVDHNKNVVLFNDKKITHEYVTFDGVAPLILFAEVLNGTASLFSTMRLFGCQIYDNDILVRDFIPVLDINNIPCLYDKVNRKFHYNKGNGQFVYQDAKVRQIAFIESTGQQ